MSVEPRLKIKLFQGWRAQDNAGGPATYVRDASEESGALQFSFVLYKGGKAPISAGDDLITLCRRTGSRYSQLREIYADSGLCDFGSFGTVIFKGTSPAHFQIWALTNQRDFILITHTCMSEPDAREVGEASQIARMTRLG